MVWLWNLIMLSASWKYRKASGIIWPKCLRTRDPKYRLQFEGRKRSVSQLNRQAGGRQLSCFMTFVLFKPSCIGYLPILGRAIYFTEFTD